MSMYRYMLDTNILSDLIKNPNGAAARRIAAPDVEQVCCTSLIVACELRYGACKKGSSVLSARIEQLLDVLPVLPLEERVFSFREKHILTVRSCICFFNQIML